MSCFSSGHDDPDGAASVFAVVSREDRRFWPWFAVVLGVVATCKGLHRPLLWAATQAQVDYRFGIVKRGFFGQFIARPLHLNHYRTFTFASFMILCVLGVLLTLYVRRSGVLRRLGNGEVLALFFASYSVTYMAHLIGYFDLLLAAMVLVCLLVRNDTVRALVSLPICIVAILIHELFLLVFLPVLLLSFVLSGLSVSDRRQRARAWIKGGLVLLVSLVTTVRMAFHAAMSGSQVEAMRAQIERNVDFPIRPDVFEVMGRSFALNIRMTVHYALTSRGLLAQLSLIVFAPVLILLLVAIRQILQGAHCESLRSGWVLAMAILASLAPLSMHLLAWDTPRFNGLTVFAAFLVMLTVCAFTRGDHVQHSRAWVRAAVVVIALNMATGEFLLYQSPINTFPFVDAGKKGLKLWLEHVPPSPL